MEGEAVAETVEAPVGDAAPVESAAPAAEGNSDGGFDWGAWTPDRDDVPEQFKPAVTQITSYYQKQLADAKAAEERAALFQQLYEAHDTGTSAEMIADMMMAKDDLESLRAQFDELNQQSSGWTTEKVELAQRLEETQAEIEMLRSKIPEVEAQLRDSMSQEYSALIQQDVDAFFEMHREDLENDAIRDAFTEYHAGSVPEGHAIQLAKMPPADQAFAKALLESGTPPNKVLPLTARAAKERTPPISPAATLTAGGAPVSRSPSPAAKPQANQPAPVGSGRFANTRALFNRPS